MKHRATLTVRGAVCMKTRGRMHEAQSDVNGTRGRMHEDQGPYA